MRRSRGAAFGGVPVKGENWIRFRVRTMKNWTGVTDSDWYAFRSERKLEDVDLWRPSSGPCYQPTSGHALPVQAEAPGS